MIYNERQRTSRGPSRLRTEMDNRRVLFSALTYPEINRGALISIWTGIKPEEALKPGRSYTELVNPLLPNQRPAQPNINIQSGEFPASLKTAVADPNGSQLAAEAVMEHLPGITKLVRRMLGDTFEVEEVIQDVVGKAYVTPPSEANSNYKNWGYRVAKFQAIDILRRRRIISIVELDHPSINKATGDFPSPEAEALESERTRQVYQALLQIPHRHRLALVLQQYGNFSGSTVAEIMGISHGRVKHLWMEARGRFKQQWEQITQET